MYGRRHLVFVFLFFEGGAGEDILIRSEKTQWLDHNLQNEHHAGFKNTRNKQLGP